MSKTGRNKCVDGEVGFDAGGCVFEFAWIDETNRQTEQGGTDQRCCEVLDDVHALDL